MRFLLPVTHIMPDTQSLLDNVAIILIHPKFAENVGAAARSAFNMGISRLILVRDEMPDWDNMAKMATHKAAPLLKSMEIHKDITSALEPFSYIVGTTARRGRKRGNERSPRQIVRDIGGILAENQAAFLFGPEDTGLSNEELKYCHETSSIPTADFSSLNLAQAVAIHCYELYYGIVHEPKAFTPAPQIAPSRELEGMFRHVEEALLKIDFLQEENHTYWMSNVRRFLGRMQLSSKESNIIRGICRQFMWYQKKKSGDIPQ